MRVIHDGFANITLNGERIHSQVRVLKDDQSRIAVFLSPTEGPAHVYSLHDVAVTPTGGGGCSHPVCRGKASRMQLTRLWENAEKETDGVAVAG